MNYNNGPKTITENLRMHLDAGFTKSYPETGNMWRDLTKNGFNVTLSGGWSFTDKSISANSANAYGIGGVTTQIIPVGQNDVTIEAWLKFTSTSSNGYLVQLKRDLTNASTWITIRLNGISTGDLSILRRNAADSAHIDIAKPNSNDGLWHHIVGTFSNSYAGVYVDGELVGEDNEGLQALAIDTLPITFFGTNVATGNPTIANIAILKLYNKTLSKEEVVQNYNVLKGRFGK